LHFTAVPLQLLWQAPQNASKYMSSASFIIWAQLTPSELRTMVVLIAYESWLSNIDVAISINHFYQALLVRIPAGYVHSFRENRAI
jgi:hypothetical protein